MWSPGTQPHSGDTSPAQGTHCLPTTPPPTGPNSKNRTISMPGQHVRGHSPAGTAPLPPRGHTACTQLPPDRKYCTNTEHNGCTNSCHRPPPTDGPDGDDLSGCATIPGHTATLGAHSHTRGTHTAGTQRPPPGLNSKNRTQLHARSEPTAGKTNRRRTQHPRGHNPASKPRSRPGDTALLRGHTACTQHSSDRTHCTNTPHNGCTDICHRPPPTDGPDAMIRLLKAMPRPGTQPLVRIPRRRPRTSPGTQPCSGDTSPAHNSPRTESTVQILHTMVAPTADTDRRRRMAPTAMISPDAPRSPGTQPHSGDTATLGGHTLPAPNAPHPA